MMQRANPQPKAVPAKAVPVVVKPKPKAKKDDDEAYTTKAAKSTKEKDPDAPKRPQTSYFLFMNDRRPAL